MINETDIANEFKAMVIRQCRKYGIKYDFPDTEKITYPDSPEIKVAGYFDDNKMELGCAIGKPVNEWLQILVHEYCHVEQWIEQCPDWKKLKNKDADILIDSWLSGKSFQHKKVIEAMELVKNIELDCEIRSTKMIQFYNLPIDIDLYIRKANSYIYLHAIMLHTRTWPDKAPYSSNAIVKLMPSFYLSSNEYFNIPNGLLDLYREHCYL